MAKKQAKQGKQVHLNDPETVAKIAKANRHKALTKEKLYPALVAATVSVDESKLLLGALSSFIMEEALDVLRHKKIGDSHRKLLAGMCPDGEREKEIGAFLELLKDDTLFDAKALIEGLKTAIEFTIAQEMRNRTLNSITPDWDKMMTR